MLPGHHCKSRLADTVPLAEWSAATQGGPPPLPLMLGGSPAHRTYTVRARRMVGPAPSCVLRESNRKRRLKSLHAERITAAWNHQSEPLPDGSGSLEPLLLAAEILGR